jgi:hypothetical protein
VGILSTHGVIRATGDLDIFVRPSPENARRVYEALIAFGAPIRAHQLVAEDFEVAGTVYQMGLPPSRIDILTSISGRSFQEVWERRVEVDLRALRFALHVAVIGRDDLIANKLASGRPKDLVDLERLHEVERKRSKS